MISRKTYIILIRILSMALQLGYIKTYTHYLNLAEIGQFFYLMTISYFLNAILFVPIDIYQQSFISTDASTPIPLRFVLKTNVISLILGTLTAAAIGLSANFLTAISAVDTFSILGLSVFLFACTSLRSILNNRGSGIFVVCMIFLESLLRIADFFLFRLLQIEPVASLLFANLTALMIEFVFIVFFFTKYEKFTMAVPENMSLRQIFRFCYPISISAVSNWLQLQGYRLVYVAIGQPDIAGLYAAVSNIGALGMSAVGQLYSQLFLPMIYQSKGHFILKYTAIFVAISASIMIGYVLFGRFLLEILTKPDFKPFYFIMLFGIVTESCNLLIGGLTAFAGLRGCTNVLIKSNLMGVGAATLILGSVIYINPLSPYLIGTSTAIPQLITLAFLLNFMRKSLAAQGSD